MKLRVIATAAIIAALIPSAAMAGCHTPPPEGPPPTASVSHDQRCDYGTRVYAHLDDTVTGDDSWVLTIGDNAVARGRGGPSSIGPYFAGRTSGHAELIVTADGKRYVFTDSWGRVPACPVHHARVAPSAWLGGPECDPMHHPFFDNRKSDVPVTFRLYRIDGGQERVTKRTVPAHTLIRGKRLHFDGRTPWRIVARQHVLNHGLSAKAGDYPCPAA